MLIKHINGPFYDVFFGIGWGNWSRVRRNHWGVSVVAGNRLGRTDITAIENGLKR